MQAPSIPSACVFRPVTSGMSSIPSHPDATCIPSHRGVPPHRDVFHHQNSSGCVLHHQIGMCHPNTWLEVSTHASSNPYKFSVMQVSIPRDGVRNGWVVAVWGAVDTSRCVWIEGTSRCHGMENCMPLYGFDDACIETSSHVLGWKTHPDLMMQDTSR